MITGIILFCVAMGLLLWGACWLVERETKGMAYDHDEGCFCYVNDNDCDGGDDGND
jgi:hypothetical protein